DRDVARPDPRIKLDELPLRFDDDPPPPLQIEPTRDVVGDRVPGADIDIEPARLIRERTGEVVVFEIGGVGQIHGGARRVAVPSIAENAPGGALAPALPVARPPLGS